MINIHVDATITIVEAPDPQYATNLLAVQTALSNLDTKVESIQQGVTTIIMDEQLVKDALTKIDAATTKAASNIQILADTDQTVSTELDALLTALKAAQAGGTGVSQQTIDQASALVVKSQAVSDSLDAMVPALAAIAAKGVSNPVPIVIPDPAPAGA